MKIVYSLPKLDCADCAQKIETALRQLKNLQQVQVSFLQKQVLFESERYDINQIQQVIDQVEEGCQIMDEQQIFQYQIENLDCADCAKKLQNTWNQLPYPVHAKIEFLSQKVQFSSSKSMEKNVIEAFEEIIQQLEPEAKLRPMHVQQYTYRLQGLDCPTCAEKIEQALLADEDVIDPVFTFQQQKLVCYGKYPLQAHIQQIVDRIEEGVTVTMYQQQAEHSKQNPMVYRIGIGLLILFVSFFGQPWMALIAFGIFGYDVLGKAIKNIGKGQIFDENFLMSLATIAAIGLQEYREAAFVMAFYQIGEYFQDIAVQRSRKSIQALYDLKPDVVTVLKEGKLERIDPQYVEVMDQIVCMPGEKIALDGIIIEGQSQLDTSYITGESVYRFVQVGDEVISGTMNMISKLTIQVTKPFAQSTISQILELVENSELKKATQEKFITKFARYYTPIVVFLAALLVIGFTLAGSFLTGLQRASTFLVISCPCALVISIPLTFFSGIGMLSRHGIMVKGANVLETVTKLKTIVFDKTGTMTTGKFTIAEILDTQQKDMVLQLAANLEQNSNHPIAKAIVEAYGQPLDDGFVIEEIGGRGIRGKKGNDIYFLGNQAWLQENGIKTIDHEHIATKVYVAKNQEYLGCLLLKDQLKQNSKAAIEKLYQHLLIVSGDHLAIVQDVANQVGIQQYHGQALPQDKVEIVQQQMHPVMFVGDGVNDAPVLANADVGVAMGGFGSQAAIEASDVIFMEDDLAQLPIFIQLARKIMLVANMNIFFAIGIKIAALILGALGIANMWLAIFADTGVTIICILHALSLFYVKGK